MAQLTFSCTKASATISGAVTDINGLDGVITIAGTDGIGVSVVGQTILISGSETEICEKIVTTSGFLQTQIDNIGTGGGGTVSDALIGVDGVTVISGSNTTTVSGFRAEFVSASGFLSTEIDTDISAHAGISNAHHSRYTQEENDAIIGSDGITIVSGSNTINVQGFRTEFVSASGFLTDHGNLSGLTDDDHTQYSLVDGTRAFSSTVGGITPIASSDLATKGYVDGSTSPDGSDIDSINTVTGSLTLNALGTITLIDQTIDSNNPILTVSGHSDGSDVDLIRIGDQPADPTVTGSISLVGQGNVTILNKTIDPANPIVVISGVSPVASGLQPHIFNFTVGAPLTGDTAVGEFFTNTEVVLTSMHAMIRGGTSPSVTWHVYHADDRSLEASGTEVVTGGTVSTNKTTGSHITSLNNPTITGGSWVYLSLSSVTTGADAPETFTVTLIEEFG